jgi:hypothetical protein
METPNTFSYMVGGYLVFAAIMLVYLGSLISRWNNLRREMQMFEEIEKNQ